MTKGRPVLVPQSCRPGYIVPDLLVQRQMPGTTFRFLNFLHTLKLSAERRQSRHYYPVETLQMPRQAASDLKDTLQKLPAPLLSVETALKLTEAKQ